MTVVYIDVLFLLNLAVDYLLLLTAARITGEWIARPRLALGAALGAGYAAALFLPGLGWLAHPGCKLGIGVLMALIAFGRSPRLLRLILVFFAVSAALGGGILAMQLLGAGGLTLENGVLYTGFNLRLVLVTAILSYALLSLIFRRAARHGGKEALCRVRLTLEGRQLTLTALVDTGNTLTDPARDSPVLVAEAAALKQLLPAGLDPSDPVGTVERWQDRAFGRRLSLLPYRAVGVSQGLLLAVRTDLLQTQGREIRDLLVALSPTAVSDGGAYQALIGDLGPPARGKRKERTLYEKELEPLADPPADPVGAEQPGEGHVHRRQRRAARPPEGGGGAEDDRPSGPGR